MPALISFSPGNGCTFMPSRLASGAAVSCVLSNCDEKMPAKGPCPLSRLATVRACCWPSAVSPVPGTAVSIRFDALPIDSPCRTKSMTILVEGAASATTPLPIRSRPNSTSVGALMIGSQLLAQRAVDPGFADRAERIGDERLQPHRPPPASVAMVASVLVYAAAAALKVPTNCS